MTDKKIKTQDELMEEAKREIEAYGLDREASPGAYTLSLVLTGIAKYAQQKESLKSPEQKARDRAAAEIAATKRQQDKNLKEHERKTELYARWCKRDTWVIESEALFLLMGRDPKEVSYLDTPPKEVAELIESCAGVSLKVCNPTESKSKWRVRPQDWVQWVTAKGYAVPKELTSLLFPAAPRKPSIAKAQESREQKKRDRQRYLKTFTFHVAQRAQSKGLVWDGTSISVTKAEFLDAFYAQYPQIGKISNATFDHDIAEIGLKFKAGTKTNPDNVLAKILK